MPIEPDVTTYLEAAVRAAGMRQTAIANNIANLDTAGYRRRAVQFEQTLAAALERGNVSEDDFKAQLVSPMNTPVDDRGNDVSIDQEIGDMVQNTGAYKTYLRLLSKLYRQIEAAVS
ncbi:MAG: flagellar basal body protein [Planctomycetaceae bacterium]|nr:flagellar basal body protein [Planctomycetaceae bacterium]